MARSISENLKAWKEKAARETVAILYEVDVAPGVILYLAEGDPLGTGEVVFDGNTYTAAAIKRERAVQSIEGELPSFQIAVSNIDGIAGGYIEQYELDGRSVKVTRVLASTLAVSDSFTEFYKIQDQQYDRQVAVFTLGHEPIFRRRVPQRVFAEHLCQQFYEGRFLDGNDCGYPSDLFLADTRQDFITGRTSDGPEKRRHGWHTLNMLRADVADVDRTEPGHLYLEASQPIIWQAGTLEGLFVFLELTGDFQVFTKVEPVDFDRGVSAGILCQEATGVDSWMLIAVGLDSGEESIVRATSALTGVAGSEVEDESDDLYLRMTRAGSTFTVDRSSVYDASWTEVDSRVVDFDADCRIGLFLSSSIGEEEVPVSAAFERFQFRSGGLPLCDRTLNGPNGCAVHENRHRFFAFPSLLKRQ